MRNNKGQALVEFAIILPVLMILIFCVIDFGRVISLKNNLENVVSDALLLHENGSTKTEIENILNQNEKDKISVELMSDDGYTTITVNKTIKPLTPGITYISRDIFNVSASRVIKNE